MARRWIEDQGYTVHDANVIFGANCPNVDLIVYRQSDALYVQVKSSSKPAGADAIVVDGSPWTEQQLYHDAPLFNKHDGLHASLVIIVHMTRDSLVEFYLVPPRELESLLRPLAQALAQKKKRDGTSRSIKFRKELPRDALMPWLNAADFLAT
ncbi:MAG: hypothetical protein ABL874_06785 [Sphingopyxis sp.]